MTYSSFRLNNDIPTPSTDEPRAIDLQAGRRAFIRSVGLGVAGAALFAGAGSTTAQAQAAVNDVNIFNFALNTEYLEAEFYTRAAFGQGLLDADVTGTGTLGPVAGGRQVPFADPTVRKLAVELANDELAHVRTLRNALGSNRVARPAIDLGLSFTLAARAAGLAGPNEVFDAFANDQNFLLASFLFEDVGVTAYGGAAPLITDKANLAGAAGILAVEAYHAGAIRALLYQRGLMEQAGRISAARDSLDGTTTLDQGIGDSPTINITPTDVDGVAYRRTFTQVLNVLYLNPNTQPSGFFPNGLNGALR
ncbi:ferritin-like domain-containing protein [uncultured Enterovirga sp.]|uniref:ferritin-like domain-containing protein n=1 Tax=uncultured Enterovirga sp. TaxID=2026352 RepID=UPI0035CC03FB